MSGQLQFIVLYGKTGCGKSAILTKLEERGEQVLHLERIAAHNGSSFGGLGQEPQPSQSFFEETINTSLTAFSGDRPVWIEYESSYLGRLQIPDFVLLGMKAGKWIVIEAERNSRIGRIVETYSGYSEDDLLDAVGKIRKKLSKKKYRLARKSIRLKDFKTAVSILLTYYDSVYDKGLLEAGTGMKEAVELKGANPDRHADQILKFYQSNLLKSRNPE